MVLQRLRDRVFVKRSRRSLRPRRRSAMDGIRSRKSIGSSDSCDFSAAPLNKVSVDSRLPTLLWLPLTFSGSGLVELVVSLNIDGSADNVDNDEPHRLN